MTDSPLDDVIRASFRARADGNAPADEESVSRVWERLEISSPQHSRRPGVDGRPRLRLNAALAAIFLIAITVLGGHWLRSRGDRYYPTGAPMATAADYAEATRAGSAQMSLPAPMRPVPGFSASTDPSPASIGQTVEIRSTEAWAGKRVWLYWAPGSEQYIVAYLRKLPLDAMLISTADVSGQDGAWALSWQVPGRLERDGAVLDLTGETVGYLVAVDDSGHLAYHGLALGPRRTLVIAPEPARSGETVTISGADYPPGTRVRIDVLHQSTDGATDLQANLGWVTTDAAGTFEFTYWLPEKWDWPFADRTGMQDHWLDVGAAGTYRILTVEQGANGPGAATEKLVDIR